MPQVYAISPDQNLVVVGGQNMFRKVTEGDLKYEICKQLIPRLPVFRDCVCNGFNAPSCPRVPNKTGGDLAKLLAD